MLTTPATIADIIHYLQDHLHETDITLHDGAWDSLIEGIEEAYGFTLPDDFKTFYRFILFRSIMHWNVNTGSINQVSKLPNT